MAYLQDVEVDWSTFKVIKTTLAPSTVYYLKNDLQYVPFIIQESTSPMVGQSLYYCGVNRDPKAASGPYAALIAGTKSSKHIQDITYTAVNYGATAARGSVTVAGYLSLAGAVLTVNGVALTEGVEWTAAVSNDATATSLASAITTATLTTLATGTATGAVIAVVANTAGAAGNAISLATSDSTHLPVSGAFLTGGVDGINGDSITIEYVGDAPAVGQESVTVVGSAITVHIVDNVSIAQQVQAAVVAWNAYTGLSQYNSAASACLVTAVIDPGQEGIPQTVQGPTPLAGGVAPVTSLSDWETNYMGTAVQVPSFSVGVGLEL